MSMWSLSHIRFFLELVGIEIHHIADAEVGQEVLALVGYAQGDGIISASGAALFLSDDVQVGIDISGILLFGERHSPEV